MDDFKLSEHFSYFELTNTSSLELLEVNRMSGLTYLPTAKALCTKLLEVIRGTVPMVINSGFRCWDLNGKTAGSSLTSQHPKFQAADIHRPGESVDDFFGEVLAMAEEHKFQFGQLIHEKADRGYAVAEWVHVSLGPDYWSPERCGEVRIMNFIDGQKIKSELIKQIPQ